MNFFEAQLRKIFDDNKNKETVPHAWMGQKFENARFIDRWFYGKIRDGVLLKASFRSTSSNNYDALALEIINPTHGRIDQIILKFRDFADDSRFLHFSAKDMREDEYAWWNKEFTEDEYKKIKTAVSDYVDMFR